MAAIDRSEPSVSGFAEDIYDLLVSPELIAYVAKVDNNQLVTDWIDGKGELSESVLERLRVAQELCDQVKAAIGVHQMTIWIEGTGCSGDTSPAQQIREGNYGEARQSAQCVIDAEEMDW